MIYANLNIFIEITVCNAEHVCLYIMLICFNVNIHVVVINLISKKKNMVLRNFETNKESTMICKYNVIPIF